MNATKPVIGSKIRLIKNVRRYGLRIGETGTITGAVALGLWEVSFTGRQGGDWSVGLHDNDFEVIGHVNLSTTKPPKVPNGA